MGSAVALRSDSSKIVSGSRDGTVRIWDVSNRTEILPHLRSYAGRVHSVAFSHDSSKIASGPDDRTVWIWDASTGNITCPPLRGHTYFVHSVAFSRESSIIVSTSQDMTIRIWDTSTGAEILKHSPIMHRQHSIGHLLPGCISVDENGWFADIATGRQAKLPTGLKFSRLDASMDASIIATWTEGNQLILIHFLP